MKEKLKPIKIVSDLTRYNGGLIIAIVCIVCLLLILFISIDGSIENQKKEQAQWESFKEKNNCALIMSIKNKLFNGYQNTYECRDTIYIR